MNSTVNSTSTRPKSREEELDVNVLETIKQCQQKRPVADVIFITSITRPFRDHAYKRKWKHTIWEKSEEKFANGADKQPPVLWIFNENTWEIQHGREPLSIQDFPFADCMLDVFEVMPHALNDISAVDAFYTLEGTPGLNIHIMDGKVLMRKVAAIAFMLGMVKDESMVIWIDVDVSLVQPLDDLFLQFVSSKDVSYLPETLCWRDLHLRVEEDTRRGGGSFDSLPESCRDFRVDTGVLTFRANEKTREFANWWMDAYSSKPGRMLALARMCLGHTTPSEEEAQELIQFFTRARHKITTTVMDSLCTLPQIRSNLGLNDIYTFALGLHAFGGELNHGWLAYQSNHCEDNTAIGEVLPGGHCYVCSSAEGRANRGAASLVSPFTANRYLAHIKGGTGIMARQHTARTEPEIKQVRTTDKELLLPKEYFPIPSHIDHRLACGDKRSKYGQIWSLHQVRRAPK